MDRRRRIGSKLLVTVALIFGAGLLPPQPTLAATDRLPDLRLAPLTNFYTETVNGIRRLRFTTIMTNEGAGPLEVLGRRNNLGEPHLTTSQRIYNTDGGYRDSARRALMEYARDGHDHWHIQGVMLYQLWKDNGITRRGTKVGFCFLDSRAWNLSLPGAPQSRRYPEHICGDSGDLTNRMGLSVGWGDEYPANFAYQWIDITTLPAGDYTVQARADEQNWYVESNETNNCAWARIRIGDGNGSVQVLASARTCQTPPASTARMERQYGDDRYQTASAVSEDAFAPGVPVVYVATGANYPDALAAGAAAGMRGGPVILVERNRLPALATTELERLNPARIVIVGSTGVVSAYVAGLVGRYQTGGGVIRLAGADRYATAAAVSANAFPASVNRVYVASGMAFPDALAAVPHAARADAPILLVRPDRIPAVVDTELKRLNPQQIILLGSSGAVSDTVRAALETYDRGGGVVRIGGKDRYATAAMISAYHMPGGAPFAYVATGENFPDALAAGPAAAVRGAPTLLARRGILPQVTSNELNRLDLTRIYVIGSPSVINGAVYDAMTPYVE